VNPTDAQAALTQALLAQRRGQPNMTPPTSAPGLGVPAMVRQASQLPPPANAPGGVGLPLTPAANARPI